MSSPRKIQESIEGQDEHDPTNQTIQDIQIPIAEDDSPQGSSNDPIQRERFEIKRLFKLCDEKFIQMRAIIDNFKNEQIMIKEKYDKEIEHIRKQDSTTLPPSTFQFPNGQLTYIAGEGLTHSAYLTAFGGLLQAQGQYPGETRFSFSCKNKHGTRITPMLQLPDKSFAVGLAQTLAWRRSGLMVRPSIQLSICPTFGGRNPGLRAELIQTLKEKLNLICGFSCAAHSSAFASLAIGRSKWNGHIGSSGIVFRLEAPLNGVGRPSFAVQFNSGAEF